MTAARVERWIRGYDAQEDCVSEHRIPDSWSLEKLQSLFGIAVENPMYDVYPLTEEHTQLLTDTLGTQGSTELAYFLEADAASE